MIDDGRADSEKSVDLRGLNDCATDSFFKGRDLVGAGIGSVVYVYGVGRRDDQRRWCR